MEQVARAAGGRLRCVCLWAASAGCARKGSQARRRAEQSKLNAAWAGAGEPERPTPLVSRNLKSASLRPASPPCCCSVYPRPESLLVLWPGRVGVCNSHPPSSPGTAPLPSASPLSLSLSPPQPPPQSTLCDRVSMQRLSRLASLPRGAAPAALAQAAPWPCPTGTAASIGVCPGRVPEGCPTGVCVGPLSTSTRPRSPTPTPTPKPNLTRPSIRLRPNAATADQSRPHVAGLDGQVVG